MFTAIALVAFSGVSMANNKIAIKKNVIYYKTEKKAVLLKRNCASFAYHMTSALEEINDECFTSQEYNQLYWYWKTYCETK